MLFMALYIADSFAAFLMLEPKWLSLFMIGLLNYPLLKLLIGLNTDQHKFFRLFRLSSPHLGAVFLMYLLFTTLVG